MGCFVRLGRSHSLRFDVDRCLERSTPTVGLQRQREWHQRPSSTSPRWVLLLLSALLVLVSLSPLVLSPVFRHRSSLVGRRARHQDLEIDRSGPSPGGWGVHYKDTRHGLFLFDFNTQEKKVSFVFPIGSLWLVSMLVRRIPTLGGSVPRVGAGRGSQHWRHHFLSCLVFRPFLSYDSNTLDPIPFPLAWRSHMLLLLGSRNRSRSRQLQHNQTGFNSKRGTGFALSLMNAKINQ